MANGASTVSEIQTAIRRAGASWTAGETSVSALSDAEKRLRLGYVPGPGEPSLQERRAAARVALATQAARKVHAADTATPVAWDWRQVRGQNYVTPVKDQGGCGSCVAFGTTAAVEASIRVHLNQSASSVDLSEAQLFYCVARQQGRTCGGPTAGWWPAAALDAYKNEGIADEACYPYVAGDQNCTNLCADWQSRATKIAGWEVLTSIDAMKQWIATIGPVVSCFTVYDDFYSYRSDVYRHVTGEEKGGHCICVVGYDDTAQCWICKNSWNTTWGDQGFFRIAYGECGIDATMWGVNIGGPSPSVIAVPLYRYWSSSVGDHFYTTNWGELGGGAYGWNFEGIQCYVAPGQAPGTVPLYRYWSSSVGDHFYTTNWGELGGGADGWNYEGIQCYVFASQAPGTVPLYRYYNPSVRDHFYTTNWGELGGGAYGWSFEGIQCYVRNQPAPYGVSQATSLQLLGGGPTAAIPPMFQTQSGTAGTAIIPPTFQTNSGSFGTAVIPPTYHLVGAGPTAAVPPTFSTARADEASTGNPKQGRVVLQMRIDSE